MKRILAMISISCGLGLVGWGVGGCGSGSTTTTPDGFPLVGSGYNLKGELDENCASVFGEHIEYDIDQSSSNLTVTVVTNDTFEIIGTLTGTVDKDANISFSGSTNNGISMDCSAAAIIKGSAKNDITLPLLCTIDDADCSVVYGNLFSTGL
jgi:hypothetical protein